MLRAKQQDMINSIKPLLDKLIQNEIRLSEKLYRKALELANEL